MPVKKPRADKRTTRVPVFFTKAEHRLLQQAMRAAKADGLSDYLRDAGLDRARREGHIGA